MPRQEHLRSEILLASDKFAVEQLHYRCVGEAKHLTKHVIRHPGAVAILPILNDDQICLIRNYRPSVDQTLIEIPAGTLEPNEAPQACAFRELAEETGYVAGELQSLGHYYLSPGILDEKMHLFVATNLTFGPANRMEDEQIENLEVSMPDALQMVDNGVIHDAKTIVALLRWQRNLQVV